MRQLRSLEGLGKLAVVGEDLVGRPAPRHRGTRGGLGEGGGTEARHLVRGAHQD